MPLGAQQANKQLAVGELLLFGVLQLFLDDLAHLAEMQDLEQLIELVVLHGSVLLAVEVATWEVVVADVSQDHRFDAVEVVQAVASGVAQRFEERGLWVVTQ